MYENARFHITNVFGAQRRKDPCNPYKSDKPFTKLGRWWHDRGYTSEQTENNYGTETDAGAIYSGEPQKTRLRVMTQNLWANPLTAKNVAGRVAAMRKMLGDVDVVCFQEVYHPRERDALRRSGTINGLFHSRYFEPGCGVFSNSGTGLFLLSRYPIIEAVFQRFMVSGRPHRAGAGNSLHAARGAALVRIITQGGPVDIYMAHLLANWQPFSSKSGSDEDPLKAHRLSQAFELAHFIRLTARSPLVILCGDLAAGPDSLCYGLQRSFARMRDAVTTANIESEGQVTDQCTTGLKDNPYSRPDEKARRHHFIFYKVREGGKISWQLKSASRINRMAKATPILPKGGPVSKHAGVLAEFAMDSGEEYEYSEEAFPLGPLMVKVLSTLRQGIHAARRRSKRHKGYARLVGGVWLMLFLFSIGGDACPGLQGVFVILSGLCAVISAVFLIFGSVFTKEELNGLQEVLHSARNIDIHLPIDEAYSCSGFDTAQLEDYMNDYYK